MTKYDPKDIEPKWQKKWLEEKVFRADDDSKKPKYYQLETFPYPSAAGLHVGHPKGYIAEDIHARYMRMRGNEVLYTMGWDAFGLPTENYAIKVGRSPKEVAEENTKNFKRQVQMFGLSYDWDREINTSSPEYYKWTQWIFIQLFKKGLAYRAKAKVNWCPKDQTVLANEQVVNGKCERCGSEIEERAMEQWFLKITDYADRLLEGLNGLDWPSATIKRQEDWIGRSEGALLKFPIADFSFPIEVFTTRPDTLFGATYVVLAPEHDVIAKLKTHINNWSEVEKYITETSHKTDLMRQEQAKEKTGVELQGIKAINPATKEEISIWIADYVLGSYGTGAIMAVPAHDERDFEFAKKFNLPIKIVVGSFVETDTVVEGGITHQKFLLKENPTAQTLSQVKEFIQKEFLNKGKAFPWGGYLIDSGTFSGMDSETAKWEITEFVHGERKTQFRLRDWSVSRQRYWGVPIPMVHCDACGIVPVPETELPVLLPELKDYRPHGMPPLASSESFINVACPKCGALAKRDPETLDTFVDSSWYYLRYIDPHNDQFIFDKKKAKHWLPVDLYVIGAEHTVLHLLYSRFITKFLHDEGWLSFDEPFLKLRHQGLIRGADGQKMSKSKGNVVNPDEIVGEFGTDSVRLYEMFMGPFDDDQPWDTNGILGVERFLKKAWNFIEQWRELHLEDKKEGTNQNGPIVLFNKTIKKVGEDIESFAFNTAISSLMIFLNETHGKKEERMVVENFVKILHPFAPHIAQEMWSLLGHESYLDFELWPEYDPKLLVEDTVTIVLQVNGKMRDTIKMAASVTEEQVKAAALANENVKRTVGGATPKKFIYVDKKLMNIVV